jgi:phage tail sheath protein FI
MPGTYTYPGVYVEEIPSGVRTIVGVSTSDTAFVDYFKRGPVNEATRITSFGEFTTIFGGLDAKSAASYAIQQYYLNGGAIAWVVRVATSGAQPSSTTLTGGSPTQDTLTVTAKNPGKWGDNLRVAVVQAPTAGQFNIVVREVALVNNKEQVVTSETFRNLSMSKSSSRYAVNVVGFESALITLTEAGLGETPTGAVATSSGDAPESAFKPLSGGLDGGAPDSAALIGSATAPKKGIHALDEIEPAIFNILCIPAAANLDAQAGDFDAPNLRAVVAAANTYCENKRAFFIVDLPSYVVTPSDMTAWMKQNDGIRTRNAAIYYPRLVIPDPLNENRDLNVGASGTLAGVYARTDATRGVWKAPAGTDAEIRNAKPAKVVNDLENGGLNPIGVNVLRSFPIFGNVAWGARTLRGADQQADEYKYIPVRRIALNIEESLFQGLKWVVFEPNDAPLWSQIRLNVGAFMHNLFRQGAFQGRTPREAYFVKCDKETTTQNDINLGIVNVVVGFAPLKPAEFVVIKIQQMAGQIET